MGKKVHISNSIFGANRVDIMDTLDLVKCASETESSGLDYWDQMTINIKRDANFSVL
jgi:hypothetical protein